MPPSKRHPVASWFGAPRDPPTGEDAPEQFSAKPSGNLQEAKALAIDFALLRHADRLSAKLVDRVKIAREYHGVRYELAVAAWFVRMGLLPNWNQEEGPEFFVDLPGTDCRLAVEAKARHRSGHLGHPGERESTFLAGDVEKLFKKARKTKVGECPLLIFIDLNGPDESDLGPEGHPGRSERTKGLIAKYESGELQAPFAMVVFTNIVWHFAGQEKVYPPARPLLRAAERREAPAVSRGAGPPPGRDAGARHAGWLVAGAVKPR